MDTKNKTIIAGGAALVAQIHPVYMALFALIVIDILSGLAKGFIERSISSDASRRGMTKKAVMLLIVATAEVGQRLLAINFPVDLGVTLGTFYCVTEITSIMENAKACGVPIPDTFMNRFKSAQGGDNARGN